MRTIRPVDILLPKDADYGKWSVVACDQFTSQPKYWQELADFIGDAPSTLKLIFPEVYLEDGNAQERIENINAEMQKYLDEGVFKELKNSFVLVRRQTASGVSRLGLVAAVDLEDYCFTHPSNAAIRSTEGVVLDRIPPRLKIRKDAPVELPHIMLLIDDRKKSVIEKLYAERDAYEVLYDFDLNMNGGHLTGYRVDADKVVALFDEYERSVQDLYGAQTNEFIFAVGDGNHSLATAQAHWNELKKTLSEQEREDHPARFALCEIENLHDDGIVFEPIHRFVFNADDADFVTFMSGKIDGEGSVEMFTPSLTYTLHVTDNSAKAIADIQAGIDEYVKAHPECSVDYIHGIEHLQNIAQEHKGVAIIMPKIQKSQLFAYVLENGTLCRKSFSMGEAEEKRYYVEAKRIK